MKTENTSSRKIKFSDSIVNMRSPIASYKCNSLYTKRLFVKRQ